MIKYAPPACPYCGHSPGRHSANCPIAPVVAQPVIAAESDLADRLLYFLGKFAAQLVAVFLGTFLAGLLLLVIVHEYGRWRVAQFTAGMEKVLAPMGLDDGWRERELKRLTNEAKGKK